ncbi:MAG TPA: hypothetical protein VJN70_10305, partial [Gemmatimonadaceae bacterium]|nr:hypothetical protein [Gemmatimonadaceae bacterium]
DAVRPELRDLPVPRPRDDLLSRILASRESGARVILPEVRPIVERAPTRGMVALFVAVVLLLLLPFARNTIVRRGGEVSAREESAASGWLAGSLAFAQTERDPRRSSVAPVQFAHPGRLRPVTLEYERTWRDSTGRISGRATGVVAFQPDSVDRVPAWRLVSRTDGTRDGRAFTTLDSVYITRADLHLLSRVVIQTPFSRYDEIRIAQQFRHDSMVGHMNAKGADASPEGRPIARRLAPSAIPMTADALAPVLFATVDLHPSWRGALSLAGWGVIDSDVQTPVAMQVDGDEVVSVPAGTFECWRLTVHYAGPTLRWWVRKSDGLAVRSLQSQDKDVVREVVLTRASQ